MDEESRLRNDSMGTNYTFRDKKGNLVTQSDGGLNTEGENDRSNERTTDIPTINLENRRHKYDEYEEDKDSQNNEEQPSMMTNSEIRSLDLNILGECYIPSSDILSDGKDIDRNEDTDEYEPREQEYRPNSKRDDSRNIEVVNRRDKKGNKVDSLDSQKIDSLLRKSIDNFIYETKDLVKDKKSDQGKYAKNYGHTDNGDFEQEQQKMYSTQGSNFPRSASQKYNYKNVYPTDAETRYVHISPLNSGSKKKHQRTAQKKQLNPTPPQVAQNYQSLPRYSSLMPQQQVEGDIYYNQGRLMPRKIQHYSFNAPRRSDHITDGYSQQMNSLNFPANQHMSLDENVMPSNMARFHPPSGMSSVHKRPSPEFQYVNDESEFRPNSQRHLNDVSPMISSNKNTISSDKIYMRNKSKVQYGESRSVEYSPNANQLSSALNPRNKRQSNQTIEEEQESKSSKEEMKDSANKHIRNYTQVPSSSNDGMLANDETVYTTNHGSKQKILENELRQQINKNDQSATPHQDSFSRQFDTTPKRDASPENKNSDMTFLCCNLYEILNRNKIPVKSNPDDNSQDMIIKVFESLAHELRLKKDRVESLENEDIEKTKVIDTLTDKNDQLFKSNQKLQKRIDEQMKEYGQTLQEQEYNFSELHANDLQEKEKFKRELERLKSKYRNLEMSHQQLQDEVADHKSEINMYKIQVQDLKYKIRQKQDTIFKNKMIRDKANASFDVDNSNENLIDNSQYFTNRRKKNNDEDNHIHLGPNEVIHTETSEDLSRAEPSAEKKKRDYIEFEKGEMFESSGKKKHNSINKIESSWFFKVIKELFAPYKDWDQNDLLNIIREEYGKFLQSENLLQLKTQIEILLGLPKNCDKSIIINKVRELRTNNLMTNETDTSVKIEDYDQVNKNFEAYEEMKNMFASIKSSLKLQTNATFTETLRAVKKILGKKNPKDKVDKRKPKNKMNLSKVALNKTKIDLAPSGSMIKKTSPNRDNISSTVILQI